MNNQLFTGRLVHLTALNPETDAELFAKWSRDTEYTRLFGSDPVRPMPEAETRYHLKAGAKIQENFSFLIRTLADDQSIGIVELDGVQWNHRESWMGVGLGERNTWGQGYGSDATSVLLRFAFTELNLARVNLNVFEYNQRAIRAYEKLGFVHEGRVREFLLRDGRRWDLIFMGLLRREWELNTEGQ